MLCENEDLSQGTGNNDLTVPTLLAGVDFDPINERADYFNLSFPKIPSGLDSHCKAESSHH
jgi:hypothetical protein